MNDLRNFNDENYYYEKYKNKTFVLIQKGYSRNIVVTICGYNMNNQEILIGRLDEKAGISGFDAISSFDFIPNPKPNANYTYIYQSELKKAVSKDIFKPKAERKIFF